MYRVAVLERPYENSQMCADIEEAEIAAIEKSVDDRVYGVWDNESGILVSIVYQQQVYSS